MKRCQCDLQDDEDSENSDKQTKDFCPSYAAKVNNWWILKTENNNNNI